MRTTSGAKGVSKGGAERAALVLRAFASAHNEHWLFGIVKRLAEMLGHRQKALLCLPALRAGPSEAVVCARPGDVVKTAIA